MELRYDISVVGQEKVRKALRSIDAELLKHQQRLSRNVGTGAAAGGTATAGNRKAAASKSEFARGMNEIAKAASMADRQRHREAMANIKREERARLAAIAKAETAERRASERTAKEQQKRSAIAAKQAERELRTVQSTRARFGAGVAASAGGAVRGAAGLIGTAAGFGGAAFGVQAVQREIATGARIASIANAGYEAGGPSRESLARGIRGRVATVANRTGRGTDDLLGSVEAFGAVSGDISGALRLLPAIADIADASGGQGDEIAKSLALAMRGIQQGSPDLAPGEVERQALAAIRVMAGQGKVGSIELADQARAGASRTVAAAGQFSGDVEKNMATMGALAQMAVASGGAASAEEGFMSITRLSSDILKKQKNLGAMGVNVFADKGRTQLRSPEEILFEAIEKSGGDMSKLQPIFGELSGRAVSPLRQIYNEAGGGEAGSKAMREALGKLQGAALSEQEVQESAAFRRGQDDRKVAMEWDKFNRTLGQELLPVLQKALPQFAAAVPDLTRGVTAAARFAAWFADNPLKGLGSIVLAAIVKDLAAAKIGAVVSSALANLVTGGGAAGAAGKAGAAANAAGAAGAAGGAGKAGALGISTLGWGALAAVSTGAALWQLEELTKLSGGAGIGQIINPLADKKGDMSLSAVGSLLTVGLLGEDDKGNLTFGTDNIKEGWHGRIGRSIGTSGKGVYDQLTAEPMTYGGAHGRPTMGVSPGEVLGRAYEADGTSRPLSDEEMANLDEAAGRASKSIGEFTAAVTTASTQLANVGGQRNGDPIVGPAR